MKPISDFFPRLAMYVMGCPEPAMQQALLDSAISFCEDSLVIRHRLDSQLTIPGVSDISVDAPIQQMVSRVLDVWVDGRRLTATTADEVDDVTYAASMPRTYYSRRNDSELQILLYPAPDQAYKVEVEVALRPLRSATSLENDLFDLWLMPVIAGALARLYSIPDQPFSNPTMSQSKSIEAARLSGKARIEGSYGRVRASGTVRPRPFA